MEPILGRRLGRALHGLWPLTDRMSAMNAAITLAALTALCASITVQAEAINYDVNVQEGIQNGITGTITPDVNTLTGSFTFDNGVFSNISVIINGQGAVNVPVQSIVDSLGALTFSYTFDHQFSDTTSYSFQLSSPLGGGAQTIYASDVDFAPFDSDQFGDAVCGSPLYGQSGPYASTYTCSGSLMVASGTPAPEIDPGTMVSGTSLMLGVLAVLRGGRRRRMHG
jgi:hypothetical protein